MKRSEISYLIHSAKSCFSKFYWALPPSPKWDVTDFGLGDWRKYGLVLVNLAEEPEYCEKLMYARFGMRTPAHCHKQKKEDIITRAGVLAIQVWAGHPEKTTGKRFTVPVNHEDREVVSGEILEIEAGHRATLAPGVYHEFWPLTDECIISEVSTANNDQNDNFFVNPDIGRFPSVEEG